MRSIQVEKVRDAVRDMCIEANYSLSPDMRCVFEKACQEEKSPLGRQILNQLSENLEIAKKDEIPICQDTGMAFLFVEYPPPRGVFPLRVPLRTLQTTLSGIFRISVI